MSDLKSLSTNTNYYSCVFNFQESYKAPLAELSYAVLAEKYLKNLHRFSWVCPELEALHPKDTKDATSKVQIFDVASFNLTKHFDHEIDFPFLGAKVGAFAAAFTKYSNSSVSIVDHMLNKRSNDTLLICYPGKVEKGGYETSYEHNENNIKSKFFAFLWHKNFITEQQLYDNGIMIGLHHSQILEEKAKLDTLGL